MKNIPSAMGVRFNAKTITFLFHDKKAAEEFAAEFGDSIELRPEPTKVHVLENPWKIEIELDKLPKDAEYVEFTW